MSSYNIDLAATPQTAIKAMRNMNMIEGEERNMIMEWEEAGGEENCHTRSGSTEGLLALTTAMEMKTGTDSGLEAPHTPPYPMPYMPYMPSMSSMPSMLSMPSIPPHTPPQTPPRRTPQPSSDSTSRKGNYTFTSSVTSLHGSYQGIGTPPLTPTKRGYSSLTLSVDTETGGVGEFMVHMICNT